MITVDFYSELGASLSEILKPEGFRRQRLLWNRREDARVAVIQLQKTQWLTPDEARFTLNLGVCFEAVETICTGDKLPRFITDTRCFPRYRIGKLAASSPSNGLDIWWVVRSDDDVKAVIDDVASKISRHGLPLFQKIVDLDSAIEMVNQGRPLDHFERLKLAIMFGLRGDQQEAMVMLNEIGASSEYWSAHVEKVISRLP